MSVVPSRLKPLGIDAYGGRSWTVRALQNRAFGILAFLVLLCIFFSFTAQNFASFSNADTISLDAAILVVIATAEAVVVLTRNYDLSVGANIALSSYIGLDQIRMHPHLGAILVLVPILIGAGCGLVNGLLVAYGRVPSVIATLATLSIFRGIADLYANGQQINPSQIPSWALNSVNGRFLGISTLVYIAVAVVAVVAALLRYLPLGREIYAVGSNPEAAAYYGLRSRRIVLQAYVLCGALVGLGGFLFGAHVGYVVPYLAQGYELTALAAVVIGGVSVMGGSGNVVGAAIGAFTLATIDNGLVLMRASEFTREFIQGAFIVIAVTVDAIILGRLEDMMQAMHFRRGR